MDLQKIGRAPLFDLLLFQFAIEAKNLRTNNVLPGSATFSKVFGADPFLNVLQNFSKISGQDRIGFVTCVT